MADSKSMREAGYTVRFRVRSMKKKRKGQGKRPYLWKAVYLRVTGPDGRVRDLYLGNAEHSASRRIPGVGNHAPGGAPPATSKGGRKQGQGTLDPDDDRTMPLFHMENGKKRYWSKTR